MKSNSSKKLITLVLRNSTFSIQQSGGLSTDSKYGRSGYYLTNLAQMNKNFVIHVNVDESELVDRAIEFALDFRAKFSRDVFVDIIGYRKFGHNEQDMPRFTQPKMYELIDKQIPMYLQYKDKLINEGVINEKVYNKKLDSYRRKLEKRSYC